MKRTRTLALAALAAAAMLIYDTAEARLGGGRSFGAQRPSVAPRAAPPPAAASQPVMPAQPGAALPARPAPPAGSGGSRWLGPIAGLAAGLGLAAMLSHFGLPEGLASFLLVALLLGGVVLVLRPMLARREQAQRPLGHGSPREPAAPAAFDASAAPEWGGAPRLEPVLGGAGAAPVAGRPLPPGFDAEAFVRTAKLQFVRLQAAHDAGDREALRDVLTREMFVEVTRELAGGTPRPTTEVVSLDAEVLDVASEGDRHWASVRFSGTLREGVGASPTAFDEVWNLSKHVDGRTGWLLAGIRQLA